MHSRAQQLQAFDRLLTIMDELREKCPWDKKQTMESLRHLTIEEIYELADAILENDTQEIKKELGDVLLHIVFYAKIGSEKSAFDIADVIHTLCDKLVDRHPHIYGQTQALTEQQVKQNWESLKLKQGSKGVLQGVPKSLPALVKATRIQQKAAAVGFDWDTSEKVWNKVEEEIAEFKQEVINDDKTAMEQEFGDVLFSMINYARFFDIDPESALERTNKKFRNRFNYIEAQAQKQGKQVSDMSLEEMDVFWEQAKTLS